MYIKELIAWRESEEKRKRKACLLKRTYLTTRSQGIQKHKKSTPPKERKAKYLSEWFFFHLQVSLHSMNYYRNVAIDTKIISN